MIKKSKNVLFIGALISTLCFSTTAFANTTDISLDPIATNTTNTILDPIATNLSGTGYTDRYSDAKDYTRLSIDGTDTRIDQIRLIVKVYNGHFFKDIGGNNSLSLDQSNSSMDVGSYNCKVTSQSGWRSYDSNKNFEKDVNVTGSGATYTVTQSLTSTQTRSLLSKYGIEIAVEGFGKVSNSTDISNAFADSEMKSVSINCTNKFASSYRLRVKVIDIGSIFVTSY